MSITPSRIILILSIICSLFGAELQAVVHDRATNSNYNTVKVTKYDFTAQIDPYSMTLNGKVDYDFKAIVSGQEVRLDAELMTIQSVRENGKELAFKQLATQSVVLITRPFRVNEVFNLTIEFSIQGNAEIVGTHWVEGSTDKVKGNAVAIPAFYTQLEAMNARRLLPCQDTPQTAARFTTRLIFKEIAAENQATPYDGFASGRLLDVDTLMPSGEKRKLYDTSFEIPTYLYAIMVGPLVSTQVTDVVEVVSRPEIHDRAKTYGDMTANVIAFYEEELGRPFQLPVMRLGFIPHNGYPYGAMENMGFIFFHEGFLADDGKWPFGGPFTGMVLAHELVHHWYGNLLSTNSWQSIFVNEGVTNYLHMWWLEFDPAFGEEVVEIGFPRSWQALRYALTSEPSMDPRTDERGYWASMNVEPRLLDFTSNPMFVDLYYKGPWVYRELENQIGRDGMRFVLQNLLPEERTVVSNSELIERIGDLAHQYADIANLPFGSVRVGLLEDLVMEPGMPMLDVTCTEINGKKVAEIKQDVLITNETVRGKEVKLARTYDLGAIKYREYPSGNEGEIVLGEADATLTLALQDDTEYVIFDPEGKRFIEFDYYFCLPDDFSVLEPRDTDYRIRYNHMKALEKASAPVKEKKNQ